MNEMARTSTRHGRELDDEVLELLAESGWDADKNFKKVAIGPDGKGIVPDVVGSKNGRKVFFENKVNGEQVGTLHEKWLLAVVKLSNACVACGAEGVLVIDDRSKKLGRFIDYYVKPTAKALGILVLSKGEVNGYAKS